MHYPGILHRGVKDGVTGSCRQLLMDAQHRLLIDCGLFQGAETSAEDKVDSDRLLIEFSQDMVKALIVIHLLIDHVGGIPYLFVTGFKGAIQNFGISSSADNLRKHVSLCSGRYATSAEDCLLQ